jgi:hypothetical protein
MNLLVDACVWSLSLRRRRAASLSADQQQMILKLQEAIAEGRVAVTGLIRQDVLSGIRDKAQFLKTHETLASFLDEEVVPADYVEAARLYNTCLDRGVQCGSVDMLLCAVAARRHFTVFTYDLALIRCLTVLGMASA